MQCARGGDGVSVRRSRFGVVECCSRHSLVLYKRFSDFEGRIMSRSIFVVLRLSR